MTQLICATTLAAIHDTGYPKGSGDLPGHSRGSTKKTHHWWCPKATSWAGDDHVMITWWLCDNYLCTSLQYKLHIIFLLYIIEVVCLIFAVIAVVFRFSCLTCWIENMVGMLCRLATPLLWYLQYHQLYAHSCRTGWMYSVEGRSREWRWAYNGHLWSHEQITWYIDGKDILPSATVCHTGWVYQCCQCRCGGVYIFSLQNGGWGCSVC